MDDLAQLEEKMIFCNSKVLAQQNTTAFQPACLVVIASPSGARWYEEGCFLFGQQMASSVRAGRPGASPPALCGGPVFVKIQHDLFGERASRH